MDPAVQLSLRLALALLLATSASHKLRDLSRFRDILRAYRILPPTFAGAAAPALAVGEATLAAALAAPFHPAVAGLGSSMLLLAYGAAIHINVKRGRTGIDCGCMGPATRVPLAPALVLRNLLLASTAALLVLPATPRDLGWLDVVTVAATTAVLATCWMATERMLALAPRVADLHRRRRPR